MGTVSYHRWADHSSFFLNTSALTLDIEPLRCWDNGSSSAALTLSLWLVPKPALAPTISFSVHPQCILRSTVGEPHRAESPAWFSPPAHFPLPSKVCWIFHLLFPKPVFLSPLPSIMLVHSLQLRTDFVLRVIFYLISSHAYFVKTEVLAAGAQWREAREDLKWKHTICRKYVTI